MQLSLDYDDVVDVFDTFGMVTADPTSFAAAVRGVTQLSATRRAFTDPACMQADQLPGLVSQLEHIDVQVGCLALHACRPVVNG